VPCGAFPPRNRACDFHRTRLLGLITWSWSPSPPHNAVAVYGYRDNPTSTFLQPLGNCTLSVGEASCSTSAPFWVGDNPIQPVMYFCCLSAAGIRFLEHPIPTGDFCRPYGWLTEIFRPRWGYHVPHLGAATGVGALSTPGFIGVTDECSLAIHLSQSSLCPLILNPLLPYKPSIPTTLHHEASSRVHLHSPVQSSPSLGPSDGWDFP
jgi:hypothetical protein